jgi:hypothetical protein
MFTRTQADRLRTVLLLDAGTCAVMGALLVMGAGPLAGLTGIPTRLLLYAGMALLPIAAFMVVTARQAVPALWAVQSIIAGNVLWIVATLVVAFGGWVAPTLMGYAFLGVQAAGVALLTVLEQRVWRRLRRQAVEGASASSAGSAVAARNQR